MCGIIVVRIRYRRLYSTYKVTQIDELDRYTCGRGGHADKSCRDEGRYWELGGGGRGYILSSLFFNLIRGLNRR